MQRVIYTLVGLLILLTVPLHAKQPGPTGQIRIGYFSLEPISFQDQQGEAQGFNPDLLKRIAAVEGWQAVFVHGSWGEGIDRLEAGEIDLMINVAYTAERDEKLDYNYEPVMELWGQLFIRPDGAIKSISDLAGRRVGIMRRGINGQNFIKTSKELGVESEYVTYENLPEVFAAVQKGEIVAGVSPQHYGLRYADRYGLVPSSIQFSPFPIYYATKKGQHRQLLSQLDAFLTLWKNDKNSFYYQRLKHWLGGQETENAIIPRWLLISLAVTISATLLLLLLSMLLKSQVKKHAASLINKERSLREAEEKFTRAFRLSPDAVNINRLSDGAYLDINAGFTRITGWTSAEAIGRSSLPGDLDLWENAEDRKRLIQELLENGEVTDFQATFNCKDGRRVIGSMAARTIEFAGEQCILSITRDITERIELQEKQKKLENQVYHAQKLESLGVLAGGIAHDFNNILTAVLGHCELALRRLAKESPARQNIDQIKSAANKAAELSNQMLAYSGKGKFVVEPLDLSKIAGEMQQMLAVSISKKAILRYEYAPNLPSVEADITQMRQIILNLVINASDAIGDKSGVIAITTGVMDCDQAYLRNSWIDEKLPPGQYVYLEVADTGCGMNAETIDRIFEPFFTTKFTGRGLGMAAVLGIIRGHHGAIKVYSEEGKGSTFKVLLPAASKPAVQFDIGQPGTEPLLGSGTVLLVDDDETVRSIGREMLEEFGFKVITADDGLDALLKFQQAGNISFVLMDLTMPHMDGEQAFRELRRLDPQVKVIMSSGYNEQEVSQKFAGKGICGFLKKPYQLSTLQKAIQKLSD